MSESNEKPDKILSKIKSMLHKAIINRHHGFHTPVFSNIDRNNNVTSRIVVLRNFDSDREILNFHTDFRSKKILEIDNNPLTFFVFYDFNEKIQLRITSTSIINHENNITLDAWNKTKLSSRKCYLAEKAPGLVSNVPNDSIPLHLVGKNPQKEESEAGYRNFVVIENKIKNIEWLYLSSLGHRRLSIDLNGKKIKYKWLIP